MNKYLGAELFSIVQKITQAEYKDFVHYAGRKSASENDKHAYIMLLDLYWVQRKNPDLDEQQLTVKAAKITNSLNDLNKKLKRELVIFIGKYHAEHTADKTERQLIQLIDSGIAFYDKKLFSLSSECFEEAVEIIKASKNAGWHSENVLYLAIKCQAWLMQLRFVIGRDKLKRGLKIEDIEEFAKMVEPFIQMARTSKSYFKGQSFLGINDKFSESSFYALLSLHLQKQNNLEAITAAKNKPFGLSDAFAAHVNPANDQGKNQAEYIRRRFEDIESYTFRIEKMCSSLLANEKHEFESSVQSMLNALHMSFDTQGFDVATHLFMYRKILEIQMLYTLKNESMPHDYYHLKDTIAIGLTQAGLFYRDEVDHLALRIELNQIILMFVQKRYTEVIDTFSEIEKRKDFASSNFYLDLYLIDIISRLQTGGFFNESTDKRIVRYENLTKRSDCSPFHKKFDGFLTMASRLVAGDLKGVFKKFLPKLEKVSETFNPIHKACYNWIRDYISK